MSNVIKLTDAKRARVQVREQANAFLVQLDAGASPEDVQQIQSWLAESSVHREVFQEMARLWDETTVLSSLSEVFPLQEYSTRPVSKAHARPWTAAAVCAGMMVALGAWFVLDRTGRGAADNVFYQHHVTEIGKQATIVLPDNSEVILNTNTEIEVSFSGSARNIFLKQGEGFFTVTKDLSRPFRVYVGKQMVEAVGTSFTVQHTEPDNVEVVVKEGQVNFLRLSDVQHPQTLPNDLDEILSRDETLSLAAGDFAAALKNRTDIIEKRQIQQDEIEVKLAWTHGMLLFQGVTLEDVLKEMNRYTTTRFEADEAISTIPVDGYFRAGDIDGLLVSMQKNFHVEAVKLRDDYIRLYRGNEAPEN